MFLLTDGGENASMEKEPQLQRRVLESGVRVFGMISFPKADTMLLPQPLSDRELQQIPALMAITGGDSTTFRWELRRLRMLRDDVRAQLGRLVRNMSESYQVSITLKRPIASFRSWKLAASGDLAGSKDWTLLYPQRLTPCN